MLKNSMIIARKEIHETFRSRIIKWSFIVPGFLFGVVFPLIFGLGLGSAFTQITSSSGSVSNIPFALPPDFFPDITNLAQRMYLVFMYSILLVFLLIVPVFLPIYIASDSFAGEKERKTIQQLLATPLTDSEILFGKILTAFIPTIVTTYLCALSITIIVNLSWWHLFGYFRIVFPTLPVLIEILLLYPLLAFFGILAICWISTRVNKVMEASQTSSFFIVPVILLLPISLFITPAAGLTFIALVTPLFALVDYGLFRLASRKFTREAILKRL